MFLPWRLGHPLGQLRRFSSYNSCMWWRRRRSPTRTSAPRNARSLRIMMPAPRTPLPPLPLLHLQIGAIAVVGLRRRCPPRRWPLVAASCTRPSTNYLLVRRPPLPQPYMSIIGESLMYPAWAMSNKLGQFCHLDGVASNLYVYNCKLDMEKICLGNTQTKVIMHLMAVTP